MRLSTWEPSSEDRSRDGGVCGEPASSTCCHIVLRSQSQSVSVFALPDTPTGRAECSVSIFVDVFGGTTVSESIAEAEFFW